MSGRRREISPVDSLNANDLRGDVLESKYSQNRLSMMSGSRRETCVFHSLNPKELRVDFLESANQLSVSVRNRCAVASWRDAAWQAI